MRKIFKKWKLYRNGTAVLVFLLFSLLILNSCEQDNQEPDPVVSAAEGNMKKMGDITLQKDVIVLNDQSLTNISSFNDHQIVFNETSSQTDSIHVGSIIMGTLLKGDDIGNILAKVTSISKADQHIYLQTESAKLEEFIYSGTISGTYDPTDTAPIMVDGKLMNYVPVQGLVSKNISKEIVKLEKSTAGKKRREIALERYSFDKTFQLPIQQAGPFVGQSNFNLKGGFTPKVNYEIKFSFGRIKNFEVNFMMDEISLKALAHINGKASYTSNITDYFNIPITPIVLGPTGLVLSPVVSAGPYLDIQTSGKADLKLLDISGKANMRVAKNPSIDIILKKESDLKVLNMDGTVSAEVGIEAKGAVALLFITTSIANSGIKGRLSARADLNVDLYPGREGSIDVIAKIQADMFYKFGINPFQYQGNFPLFAKEYPVYNNNFTF
ncbi:hypothetical protein [Chryseobacterium indologenes]|uniref:hypothetical protein n=1 Tax=Chryseobacterium indologenes TaxID=253 RepID=UPI0021A39977|nr:hypothetical protein [Elizabethkingia anophelis]